MSTSASHARLVQERVSEMNEERRKRKLPPIGYSARAFYAENGNGGRDAYDRWRVSGEGRGYFRVGGRSSSTSSPHARKRNKKNRKPKTSKQNDSTQFLKALGLKELSR